jgi:hypothetical protein
VDASALSVGANRRPGERLPAPVEYPGWTTGSYLFSTRVGRLRWRAGVMTRGVCHAGPVQIAGGASNRLPSSRPNRRARVGPCYEDRSTGVVPPPCCSVSCASKTVRGCHGHRPVSSTSGEKLRNVRIATIIARTSMLANVGSMATVRMMSPATRSSRPSRMPRPIDCRSWRYDASKRSAPARPRPNRTAEITIARTMTATPTPSTASPAHRRRREDPSRVLPLAHLRNASV